MIPHLGPIPTHELFVGLGVAVAAVVFFVEARRRGQADERLLHVVLGAVTGTWLQHIDLRDPSSRPFWASRCSSTRAPDPGESA